MNKKMLFISATALMAGGILTACGNSDNPAEDAGTEVIEELEIESEGYSVENNETEQPAEGEADVEEGTEEE
ncbi:hypothetical protein ACE1TI_05475 [Alteribacillus sp. JSM 102045]|uniref:hypothetical protein n=1 Tax=Alteribacillus sp. JSM 102045 TaxID=1562101 RepID=UPI0035C0622B